MSHQTDVMPMGPNWLRRRLHDSDDLLVDSLSRQFAMMESLAYQTWVPALGSDKGSHSGLTHLQGVEEQICSLLERGGAELSAAECFVLLAAVLLHDLGRTAGQEFIHSLMRGPKKWEEPDAERRQDHFGLRLKFRANASGKVPHHALVSALFILQKDQQYIGIRDRGLAKCVALACAAHYLPAAEHLRQGGFLEDLFLDRFGRIRVGWLACLLALGDEFDDSYHRAAPGWIRPNVDRDEIFDATCQDTPNPAGCGVRRLLDTDLRGKGNARAQRTGCEVDLEGRLLVVHGQDGIYDKLTSQLPDVELYGILKDLSHKNALIRFWGRELRQIHLELMDVALSVKGHLFGLNRAENNIDTRRSPALAVRLELPEGGSMLQARGVQLKRQPNSRNWQLTVNPEDVEDALRTLEEDDGHQVQRAHSSAKRISRARVAASEGMRIKAFADSFRLMVEPTIRQMKVDRILEAAYHLRLVSFGKTSFPWETLASEAGIERLAEVRLIFHRLLMLSFFFNNSDASRQLRISKPSEPGAACHIRFTELDGEWTLQLVARRSSTQFSNWPLEEDIRDTLSAFRRWIAEVISCEPVLPPPRCSALTINNDELAFMLDELENVNGIKFPESTTLLFKKDSQPNMGINLVIIGPPGVGKSTLAMELVTRCEVKKKRAIAAYYSLEQPQETILDLAKDMGMEESEIVELFPNRLQEDHQSAFEPSYVELYRGLVEKAKKLLLLLPKLSPRAFGETENEDRLYWFRYKQIARLLEAARATGVNDAILTAVVLDNLNAFSHHALARQRVYQLFKLLSWAGVLGIYIIEDNPAEEFRLFRTEVEALADIVVRLGWGGGDEYRFKVMEVLKSRCQRNVLGIHPFKIFRDHANSGGVSRHELLLREKDVKRRVFQVFPSLHSQVARMERRRPPSDRNDAVDDQGMRFAVSEDLCKLVHKTSTGIGTGLRNDAFVLVQGRSGGHKLAVGMNYIHAKAETEDALILNMGQPITYEAVADFHSWKVQYPGKPHRGLAWENQKLAVDFYGSAKLTSRGLVPSANSGGVYVLNFDPGFLLPEEFMESVKLFLTQIAYRRQRRQNLLTPHPVRRVLFSSTAHLPHRFPALDRDPLLLTALVRFLKSQEISLMIIGVEGEYRDDRVLGIGAMADVRITMHHFGDERLPSKLRTQLNQRASEAAESTGREIRIISSDNVTGKDYQKRYAFLDVDLRKSRLHVELLTPPQYEPM